MTSEYIIYHNPRCSKSRNTLELLRNAGVAPTIIEYLEAPPSVDELRQILAKLSLKPRELMRTKEAQYADQGLDDPTLNDDQLIATMVEHPVLIERPIVIKGSKAVIGRPPENVLALI
ncbi:MAG: arsenate reductase (glutaredoxin) [Pseudomonadota bacterium]